VTCYFRRGVIALLAFNAEHFLGDFPPGLRSVFVQNPNPYRTGIISNLLMYLDIMYKINKSSR
jgi:hypothetical protein